MKINMGLKTVKTVGFLTTLALCAGTYFIGISPILASNAADREEINDNRLYIESQAAKLLKYESGEDSEAVEKATRNVENFVSLVPTDERVESSSRAVAEALVPGVTLNGFTFNPGQPVKPIASIDQQLAGYNPLAEFSGATPAPPAEGTEDQVLDEAGGSKENLAENTAAGDPNAAAPTTGFVRFPFTINVTADNYNALSSYLENLATQSRLLHVVSVDVTGTDAVTATIYAFSYANS